MGAVFEAEQLDLPRKVALKVLNDIDPVSIARLRQEALTAGSSQNPHVVAVLDFQPGPPPFLVMELLVGESLRALLRREGRIPVPRAIRIAAQILAGLEAAHVVGVIHRDVKPSNVWLCRGSASEEHVKLLDFGVAKLDAPGGVRTATGHLLGTPAYMAPEQLRGEAVDRRADIHAVGVLLFEMLTGNRPWPSASTPSLPFEVLDYVPPRLDSLAHAVPASLADVVARSLAKRPAERFGTAAEMAYALMAALPAGAPSSPALPVVPPSSRGMPVSTQNGFHPSSVGIKTTTAPYVPPAAPLVQPTAPDAGPTAPKRGALVVMGGLVALFAAIAAISVTVAAVVMLRGHPSWATPPAASSPPAASASAALAASAAVSSSSVDAGATRAPDASAPSGRPPLPSPPASFGPQPTVTPPLQLKLREDSRDLTFMSSVDAMKIRALAPRLQQCLVSSSGHVAGANITVYLSFPGAGAPPTFELAVFNAKPSAQFYLCMEKAFASLTLSPRPVSTQVKLFYVVL